jgi:hypothetical protein
LPALCGTPLLHGKCSVLHNNTVLGRKIKYSKRLNQPHLNMRKVTLIIFLLLSLVGCDSSNRSASQAPSSAYKSFEIEGISLDLPSAPSGPQLLPTPPSLSHIIKRQAGYESGGENCSVLVFHVEQDAQHPTNLKFAVDGALENMQRAPGTADFISQTVNNYPMAGLNTSEIIAQLKHNGIPKEVQILTIANDNHLYQITIEGETKGVKECASRVFPSIKIKPRGVADRGETKSGTNIAGLNLNLPGQPQKAEFGLARSAKENTASQESYIVQGGTTQYAVCKTVHYAMNDSLGDNARGIVDGHEGYSIVDMHVSGLNAKRITLDITMDHNTQYLSILLFSKDKTLWQIATIDPSITKAHAAMDALIPTIKVIQ